MESDLELTKKETTEFVVSIEFLGFRPLFLGGGLDSLVDIIASIN